MARQNFYNENQFRDYPFIQRVEPYAGILPTLDGLPILWGIRSWVGDPVDAQQIDQDPIVDFNAIMGVDSGFYSGSDIVYLHQVTRTGNDFSFRFRTSAAAFTGHTLDFTATISSGYQTHRATLTVASDGECASGKIWEGFLITSNLDLLANQVIDGSVVNFPDGLLVIEPARIQSLAASHVNSISIANKPRITTSPAAGCPTDSEGETPLVAYATCFTGDVVLKEGYNAVIRQDRRENTFTLGAGVDVGAGEPCDEVPLYPSEASPDGGNYLTGGLRCSDIVKSINGVGGSNLTLRAGAGFRILVDPADDNTLIVHRALDDFALCVDPPLVLQDSSSVSAGSSDSSSSDSSNSSSGAA